MMTVRELYEQLRPFMGICPDQEIVVHAPRKNGTQVLYPVSVDRSDWGDRSLVVRTITVKMDDYLSRKDKK